MRWIIVLILTLFAAAAARAEAPRPPGWATGGASESQEIIDQMRKLVDDADRKRAANPVFLEDLRNLARRYDRPWRVEVLYDDFSDGNFTANPAWTVAAGRFAVEWGYGLRSVILARAPQAAPQPRPEPKQAEPQDLPGMLLKGFLQQQQRRRQRQQPAAVQPVQPVQPDKAEIFAARKLTNAFSIRLELSSRVGHGRFEFGPYRGASRATGYRLVYLPGAKPGLQLVRASQWGTGIVDAYGEALVLEDGKSHIVDWKRGENGFMTVAVDGKQVIAVTDRGFADPFDGFVLRNDGGDFGLTRILINGTF
jgi:hypothetical protein